MTFYLDRKWMIAILMNLFPILFSLRDQVSDYFYHVDNEINLPQQGQISGTD